jgi:ribose transport system substrate-binding protein
VTTALVGAVLGVAACGDDSDSTSGDTSASEGTSSEQVQQEVDTLLGAKGTYVEEPTESPTPPTGKKVTLVSCGQAISSCANSIGGAKEAADALGWKATIVDTKGDPATAQTGIRQAIASGTDGIYVYFLDCQYIRGALQDAKDAGVPVVTAEGYDCSQSDPGSPTLFTYNIHYNDNEDYIEHANGWGRSIGNYAIAAHDGKSNAIVFGDDTLLANKASFNGIEEAYADCDACTLEVVKFPLSAFGTSLQRIAEQELLKNPDVDSVLTTYEAVSLEVYPAVRASGKDILTFYGEGGEAGMDLLRENGNGFVSGWTVDWEGWAAMDALNRIFNGEDPVHTGQGIQLVDSDHNMTESGPFQSPIDFQSMYKQAWGVD